MSKWTPEPWQWLDFGSDDFALLALPKANANRAIACVNACAGMSDPEKTIAAFRTVADMHEIADAENEALLVELDALRAERDGLIELVHAAKRAIGEHCAPNDCYATGPATGDLVYDLVECPACSFLAMYGRAALARSQP